MDWTNKTVLVTGGTGSFGKKFTKIRNPKLKKIFRRSRRAERAGVLDAFLSSGARGVPELE